ncbi:silent chromatin protein ESC1-like [Puntigrus tetrazona]|uniref:silent chromatin protein ESC1-like n=1 Tax=Puntigrus tetrazona TaxID=1606681 RepID=UPI001C8A39D9|nr:silent chromatin protein ESC1-like [Puntigrus tetrazona]
MAFPVDILTKVDHETLELKAKEYMSQLPYRNKEYFSLSDSKQIEIGLCNVSFVPLYGTDTEKKILALFSPDDFNTVLGLYLLDRWWGAEDVLKTVEPSKTGLIEVSTLGERIVLYVLNRIVLRKEKSSEDVIFLCHCEHEAAKILWKDGEAIGFYSFKPKGSLCRNFVTQCYQLPVMDTLFVRKTHRGQGYAIKILEDFVGSFRNEYIGLKFPLTKAMFKVCEKYFSVYPADKELLWEVENIGSSFQRTLIANRLQKLKLKEKDQVVSQLNFDEEDAPAPMEIEFTKIQETTEYTVEIVEKTIIDVTKVVDDIPVTTRGRSSNLKRRAIRENSEERLSENIIRVEDIEAGVKNSDEVEAMENLNTFSAKESETVLRSSVGTVTATMRNFAECRRSQKKETREIEKDIVTATSEGSAVTPFTTAREIKCQSGSKEECEMVIREYTIDIQGATIGSIDQNQPESVVDVENVKMSTGTKEEKNETFEKNKEPDEDTHVCESETEEIKQMLDELNEEKTVSETEVAEQSEAQSKWDVEKTGNKERSEDEVMLGSGKDLTEESRDDKTGQEKSEPKEEDTVLQQSVEVKTVTNKDALIEKAEQVFNKSNLPQKRTSDLTPSNRSKRLRHQPAEKDIKATSVTTGQQRSKHHSKTMMQDEYIQPSTDETEHDVIEKIQEAQTENKAESEVEEYTEKEMLTVETVTTMDVEITQVEQTVFPQSSVESPEIQETKTTSKEGEETVENSTVTMNEVKVVLVDLHEFSPKESGDNQGEIGILEQEEMKVDANLTSDENPERDELIAEDVILQENEMANTNADETTSVECGSSELLRAAIKDDKEKERQITKVTGEILLIETGAEENVAGNRVEDITIMENKEANLAGQMDRDVESFAQEEHVQEEEVPISTERHLRRRTIPIQTPMIKKSRCVQKQKTEPDIEHQERHTVVSKNKTDTILMTKEREDEIDQDVNKLENKEELFTKPVEEPNMSRNEYEKTSAIAQDTVDVCIPIMTTETSLESLEEMVNTNTEETAVSQSSELPLSVEINDQEKEFQIVDRPEEKVLLIEPVKEVENDNGTPLIQLQRATVVLVDFSKLSQNTERQGEASEELRQFQMEEKWELYEPDKSEQELSNLTLEKEKQEEVQTQEGTEKTPEEEKTEEENTVEEQNKLDKQDITFEEQKPTEDLATITAEVSMESNTIENKQNEDEGVSNLVQENAVQENLEEEASVSMQQRLRQRTISQSPPRRKSRRIQKQREDKTETVLITEKEVGEVDQSIEVVEKEPQISIVHATEKVIPLVESLPEDNEVEKGDKEINKLENKETHLPVTRQTDEETPEVEEANLEQQQNELLGKNDKETAETETSMEFASVFGKEQTYIVGGTIIQTEEKVSLAEAEFHAKGEKDDGTSVIHLQKATVVLVDLNKLSQITEGDSNIKDVLTSSQTEEKLDQDEPDNSEYQQINVTSEEKEQLEQLEKEEDTEKTPEKDKMEDENTVEEHNELYKQDITFEQQKPTEDLEEQNDLKQKEIVEGYRREDEDEGEAAKSGEHPEKITMADETNIIQETEKVDNITEKQTDSDIDMHDLAQEASETDHEVLEEEASVSTERSLRRKTVKILSPPRRKSRRLQKKEAETFEDKTKNMPIIGKVVEEMQKTAVEATEVIPSVKAVSEDNVVKKEEINKMENKETILAVTKDPHEETPEVEEANLEQQQNELLGKNDKETAETETSMDVVDKERIVGETTIQTEEKVSQVGSIETNQSDNERITSLKLSVKSVTATQKARKSPRLHKVELESVKETTMSRNEHEETSEKTEETVNLCMPVITVDSILDESLDEMANTNVEKTTAIEAETFELLMGEEIIDKEEVSQTVEEDKTTEAEPHEETVKDDSTPVILQTDPPLLVDLNKRPQNTEEQPDTREALTHFHTEEQLEMCEPDDIEYHLCNLTSEGDKQDMTVEGQKPTEDINDGKERKTVEEYKVVIDEDVEESLPTGDHPKTTTMEDNPNTIQDIPLKEKQKDSDLQISSLGQEEFQAVKEILEEEASVSTERSLRRRTIKIQSTPAKKSRRELRQDAGVFEDKTGTVQLPGEGDEEVHNEGAKIDKEEILQKTTVDAIENIVSLIEPDENVIEKGFEEINKETTPEMDNEIETAETENPMGVDEVSVVNMEQTYILEKTTIQEEKEILQMESSETSENKSEGATRRSLRISSQSVTSSQKTRKSARLHKAESELVNKSRNEETSSMTAKMVNVCVPITIETNVENLDEDGDVSTRVKTTLDEQDIDISNDEALPEISTDVEEDETMTLFKITENEIQLETDKMQKDMEEVQEKEKAEPSQENTEQEQEAVSLRENVGETDLTNEFKTAAVEEKVALENSEQEATFITRSLRYRTVTVRSTPRSKLKCLHRQELELERETSDLNVPVRKENEDRASEFKYLEAKEEDKIQTITVGNLEKSETKDDTKEEGKKVLFEIVESNSGSRVNSEMNKTQEDHTEREDMPVPNEQEEEVSSVQKEETQERENEGTAEGGQGSSADLEETAAERRSLRKRMTVEAAAPRKSKRLCKQEHDDDCEKVKEAVMGQTDSAEVTFTQDCVELRSDATAAIFEESNLDEEILQKIQKNEQKAKSDGDCHVHEDTEPDAGESQEEQKESRSNKTQADEDQQEVLTGEIVEEVIEQHVDLESSASEGFTLALEVEETSDQEENNADEASKEISTSAEKYEKGEENMADDDEKTLAVGKHVVQSSSTTASTRRKSVRLQMHESKTKEDESDSESEVEQTAQQRRQRKRKAITDSASVRRSRRYVRARIV